MHSSSGAELSETGDSDLRLIAGSASILATVTHAEVVETEVSFLTSRAIGT